MITLIGTLFAGLFIGYLARGRRWTLWAGKSVSGTVYILLFLMGIGVGGNRELLANLSAVGAEALVLSLSATAGSIAVGAWMYKKLLERGNR